MIDRDVVLQFFDSWRLTGKVNRMYFSEDFVFHGPSPIVDADAWLSSSDVELPMENVAVLQLVSTEASVALLFEGVDPVTLLTYRVAWFFSVDEGKISRLSEVSQSI